MRLLNWPRRSGKSTYLINKAKVTGAIVITHSRQIAKMLREQFSYPRIYGGLEEYQTALQGRAEFRSTPVYIDEIELVLGVPVVLATTSDRDIERDLFVSMCNDLENEGGHVLEKQEKVEV